MQENRTELQIFLSKDGPRVDCGKPEGFFSKTPGPNRYPRILAVRSRSGGLDLKDPRSNLGHMFQIGRL